MAEWREVRSWTFEGPGEAGADIEGGHAFALEHTKTAVVAGFPRRGSGRC